MRPEPMTAILRTFTGHLEAREDSTIAGIEWCSMADRRVIIFGKDG
jgi:hypothetical protein